jgi:alanine dehydrogenase
MPLLLNREEVQSVLTVKECIEAVEKAFAELAEGTAVLPQRLGISTAGGVSLYMPACLQQEQLLTCKVVSVYKENPTRFDLPTTIGTVLVQNPESGQVICIMDGSYLTAVRTGAVSAVATRYLARRNEPQVAGIFGAGAQARMQLQAVKEVRRLSRAIVYDIRSEACGGFVREMSERLDLEVTAAATAEEVLEAQLICTASSSAEPLFDGKRVREGTHINCIGSHTPVTRELDTALIRRAKVVGDCRQACFSEAGDLIIPLREGAISEDHFYAELGEIITGRKAGRITDGEITVFKSNGLAIQDAAAAGLVLRRALAAGIGTRIDL